MSDTIKDISKLKVADLKRELKVRGLSTVGNKQELQDRLQVALQDGTDSALLLDDTGTVDTEDILNEDDVLADEDDANTSTPPNVGSSPLKRQLEEELEEDTVTSSPATKASASQVQDNGRPAKKITLNRKVLSQQTVPVTPEPEISEDTSKEDAKKVVKLSEISMKERLALRAVKFGAPASTEAKKLMRAARFETSSDDPKKAARAARFGLSASSVTSASNVPEVNVDLLKKRAERFGVQLGSKIEQAEMEEKKKRRLERFGGSPTSATNGSAKISTPKSDPAPTTAKPGRIPITAPASSAVSAANMEEKKKVRAERFKSGTAVSAK